MCFRLQIASAMHFISDKGILHLDLATRNVLLTHPHEVAKISDFGLSKFMSEIEPDEKFGSRGKEMTKNVSFYRKNIFYKAYRSPGSRWRFGARAPSPRTLPHMWTSGPYIFFKKHTFISH